MPEPHHKKSLCHLWGQVQHLGDPPESERVGGGGEEEDGSGQLQ